MLQGNATATDIATGATVTLNEIDPDSITIEPAGELVLDDQAGSALVFVANPGTPAQSVNRLALPTQVDDTVWATTRSGTLFVVDATANAIYTLRADFVPGTVFTEMPDDSSVPGMVGMVNLKNRVHHSADHRLQEADRPAVRALRRHGLGAGG